MKVPLMTFVLAAALASCGGDPTAERPDAGAGDGDADTDGDSDGDAGDEELTDWEAAFDHVFPGDRVVEIHIDFEDANAYAQMVAAAAADHEDTPFNRATFRFDGEELRDVGVRLKGNSSLWNSGEGQQKSLKVHFEEFVNGQRFHEVDRLNLHNNFRDPSIMRERLAYTLANELGIVAPRTAYAEVWVDGERHGVYTMVQQVDHRFLRERFGEEGGLDDGNLYKCYDGCPLEYWGDDPELYQGNPPPDVPSPPCAPETEECGLVLKTNEDDPALDDYADIVALTRAIADARAGSAAPGELEALFDVDHYLRFQAWTLALSSLDSYFVTAHNFYLYRRVDDGRFQFIPWDVNLAYGTFGCPERYSDRQIPTAIDVLAPCGQPVKPLLALVAATPEYVEGLCAALDELLAGVYTVADQEARIAAAHALVGQARMRTAVMEQPAGGLDSTGASFSYDDYLAAQSSNPPVNPTPGIVLNLGFFNELRIADLEQQVAAICEITDKKD